MLTNVHVRGVSRARLVAAIEGVLAEEGFVPSESEAPASQSEMPGTRRIVVYEEAGWVGLADDPCAGTMWGEELSRTLEVPVVVMSADCDHAFFSEVSVYEHGEQAHVSKVPEDAALGKDGRHRVRPQFLASYIPEAKKALAAGIVVRELGGEENMQAVGGALGIPRPLVASYENEDADVVLHFRHERGDGAVAPGDLQNEIAQLLGGMGLPMMSELVTGLANFIPGARSGGAPSLEASPSSSRQQSFVGKNERVSCTFTLAGGHSVRGLLVEISGDGLALFDPRELTAHDAEGREHTAQAERAEDVRRFRFPDVSLSHAPSPGLDSLPPKERWRQSMQHLRSMAFLNDTARVAVQGLFKPARTGEGSLTIRGISVEPEGLEATSLITMAVRPALRIPCLPSWAMSDIDRHFAYADDYAKREHAFGWIAFDTTWSKLREFATETTARVLKAILTVTGEAAMNAEVRRKGGEMLQFRAPVRPQLEPSSKSAWKQIADELARGADVTLGAGESGPRIEILNQPDGSNLFPGMKPAGSRRIPPIVLAWSVPRPSRKAGAEALGLMAREVLSAAGGIAANIGGVASAQGEALYGPLYDTPYERMAETRMATNDAGWLASHVRAPGWLVLVPRKAVAALDATPPVGVEVLKLKSGILVGSSAHDPFAYSADDAELVERFLLPAIGTPQEIAAFR